MSPVAFRPGLGVGAGSAAGAALCRQMPPRDVHGIGNRTQELARRSGVVPPPGGVQSLDQRKITALRLAKLVEA